MIKSQCEFLVADGYGDFAFIPIYPKLAFWVGECDWKINNIGASHESHL
jgi:hypothetical protein